jgi:hypothetical protein
LGLHYLHAHQIALRAERDAVKGAGVAWWAYQRFMKKYERQISEESIQHVPASLDLTPYRDEKGFSAPGAPGEARTAALILVWLAAAEPNKRSRIGGADATAPTAASPDRQNRHALTGGSRPWPNSRSGWRNYSSTR